MENLKYTMWEINSPSLAAAGYDSEKKVFVAILNHPFNFIYFYKDVPQATWDEFWASEEKGVYFAVKIRNRYKYERDRRRDYFD